MREWLTPRGGFTSINGGGKGPMPKDKNNNWGEFIRYIRKPWENKELQKRLMEETEKYEIENFLFMSSGDGYVIRGMHYPDSAFSEEDDIPVVYKTSEEKVLIAAYPQSLIKRFLEIVNEEEDKSKLEDNWEKVLQTLSTVAELKIRNGEVHEPY